MPKIVCEERGVALVVVLMFGALTFILIASMLLVSGNEAVVSGLHRDSVRALDLSQAGVQEALRRMQQGRPYLAGFTGSLNPRISVTVRRMFTGVNAAYLQVQASATAGGASRTLDEVVVVGSRTLPPNITFAGSLTQAGNAAILAGDAYALTFLQYQKNPTPGYTYAGWRISKTPPGGAGPCYNHAQCVSMGSPKPNWYPGQRRTAYDSTALGQDIKAQTKNCAAGGGSLPPVTITGVLANDPNQATGTVNVYGFDTDDPGTGPLAVNAALPCGLPYKYIAQSFTDETGIVHSNVLFKTIVYEQWFSNYWQFDETQLTYVKTTNLTTFPQFGAVPPFPDISSYEANFDTLMTGGGIISGGTNLGCKYPEMSCVPAVDQPKLVVLTGNWQINGPQQGHGTLIVDGSLTVDGQFTYWGTIIVNGTYTQGAGNATIYGGLIAQSLLDLSGNLNVTGGGDVNNVPVGPLQVIGKAWWQR